jgi:hypothetical protein
MYKESHRHIYNVDDLDDNILQQEWLHHRKHTCFQGSKDVYALSWVVIPCIIATTVTKD